MESVIPPAILEVIRTLQAAGHQAFLVGGCVRDQLRGAVPKDFDIATSALPADVQQAFKRVIPTGEKHGTVTVVIGKHHVEVTTFRTEGDYVDGRRPEKVEFHSDVEADLSRRDFTINAMARDPFTGRLVDPFGGEADLKRRLIRCVRDARERFNEDGLRCLRAVRFATVLDFTLDPATEAAIPETIAVFKKVAMERVRDEFQKLLLSEHAVRGLKLLRSTGLMKAFLIEAMVADLDAVAEVPFDLEARVAVLLAHSSDLEDAIARLKLPNKTGERITVLVRHYVPPKATVTDKELRLWIRDVGPAEESLAQQLAVCVALGQPVDALRPRIEQLRKDPLVPRQLALNGGEIMAALGTGPGPKIGEATRFLMNEVLEDPSRNTPERLRALLTQFAP